MSNPTRSTPQGYAPLEFSGNGCLRQPMQTFFYCGSHESQQRGKTPRVKVTFMHFEMITLWKDTCAVAVPSPKQAVDNCKVSKSFLVGTYIHWILSGRNDRGPICLFRDVADEDCF